MSFQLAKQLAHLAADLDESRTTLPPEHLDHAFRVCAEMHELAYVLAGARYGEIYGEPDEALPISPLEETCV